jgi:hypothetical protein
LSLPPGVAAEAVAKFRRNTDANALRTHVRHYTALVRHELVACVACQAAYNTLVVDSHHQNESAPKPSRHAAYAETSGLLLIAFLLLILTVIRYWHAIHWSLR